MITAAARNQMKSEMRSVCVVGGGPAGLSAAIALRQSGHQVTVVDCSAPPIDKACGEGLMPDSVFALGQLGVAIPSGAGFPFQGIRLSDGRSSVAAEFPIGPGIGLRRTVLHELLVRRAEQLGATFVWGAKNVRLAQGGVFAAGKLLAAELVVGADGQNSQIRRQAVLGKGKEEHRRYGFRRHYRVKPWSPYVELHWGSGRQIYVSPIAEDEVCLALMSRDPKLRLADALDCFPEVRQHLENVRPVSTELGAVSVTRSLQHVYRKGIALIGDASGSIDAISGEGMCLSFQQAMALSQALDSCNFEQYEHWHKIISKRPRLMARLLLSLERDAGFRSRILATLARRPHVFASLVAIHVGASSFSDLFPTHLLDFGLAFLTA